MEPGTIEPILGKLNQLLGEKSREVITLGDNVEGRRGLLLAAQLAEITRVEAHLTGQSPSSIATRMEQGRIVMVTEPSTELGEGSIIATASYLPLLGEATFAEMQEIAEGLYNYRLGILNKGTLEMMQADRSIRRSQAFEQQIRKVGEIPENYNLDDLRGFVGKLNELGTSFTAPQYRRQGVMTNIYQHLVKNSDEGSITFGIFNPANHDIVTPFEQSGLSVYDAEKQGRYIPFAALLLDMCPFDDSHLGVKISDGALPAFAADMVSEETRAMFSFERVRNIAVGPEVLELNSALQRAFGSIDFMIHVLVHLRQRHYRNGSGGTPVKKNQAYAGNVGNSSFASADMSTRPFNPPTTSYGFSPLG